MTLEELKALVAERRAAEKDDRIEWRLERFAGEDAIRISLTSHASIPVQSYMAEALDSARKMLTEHTAKCISCGVRFEVDTSKIGLSEQADGADKPT